MSPENAILVGTISNEYTYMAQLRGPNGHKVKYKRLGSCCAFTCESCVMGMGLLDRWQVKGKGFKKKIIYINGYQYQDPKVPNGMGIVSRFR